MEDFCEETTNGGPFVPVLASVSGANGTKAFCRESRRDSRSPRAGGGGLKTKTMKSFFLWGTGNEILVRCEPVEDTGENTKEGDDVLAREDGEREEESSETPAS